MEPFDNRSIDLILKHRAKRILDFGSGAVPRFAQAACAKIPNLHFWCTDSQTVEQNEYVHFISSQVFISNDHDALKQVQGTFDLAHSSFVFHEICSDWSRGEEIGGIHTPEAINALNGIRFCLQPGAVLDLVDFVACDFYDFLEGTKHEHVLQSAKHKRLVDLIYETCIRSMPTSRDLDNIVEIIVTDFGLDGERVKNSLTRLFVEYPRISGAEIRNEKDEIMRLFMHLRKYKDHHTRCDRQMYENRLKQTGFRLREAWTPDGMRYQFVCSNAQ